MIDLFQPFVPKEAVEAACDVLRSRWIGQAKKVDEFEKRFCEKFHLSNATTVNSGTSALETAYDLIGLRPGDEVITTPLTCTATNLPLLHRGVKIVWADILEKTLCIDPLDVRSKITDRTKAIVQVHLGGLVANVGLVHWQDEGLPKHIPVVSDAAQAIGVFNGDYTCCSFQAIKQFTTIDGGMLVCPDAATAHRAKLIRWFGIDREKKIANHWQSYRERKMTFDIEEPGFKRHMHDVSAAMGIVGLEYYDAIQLHRSIIFNKYKQRLSGISGVEVLDCPNNKMWLCTILVDDRDDFAKMMFAADVDVNTVQTRNDIYKVFGGERADLPIMNKLEHKYISLPMGMHVTEEDVDYICDNIQKGW